MIKKIALYAALLSAGATGSKLYEEVTKEEQTFYTVKKKDQTYLVDNEAEIPILRVNNKPQLGDRIYRLEGLLEEERERKKGE